MHGRRRQALLTGKVSNVFVATSVIAATLNHKDLKSTQIYARLNTEAVRSAVEVAMAAMLHS